MFAVRTFGPLVLFLMLVFDASARGEGAAAAARIDAARSTQPPATRREVVVDPYHGDEVADPYRWLEAMDAPETIDWIKRQDAYGRSLTEAVPGRDAILARLEAIGPLESTSAPRIRGARTFYQWNRKRDDRPVHRRLVVSEEDAVRVLVDLDDFPDGSRFATFSGSGSASFRVSPDGRFMAFGIRSGNSRWTSWYVHDVDAGERLTEVVPGIHMDATSTVWWSARSDGFFYAAHRDQAGEEGVALRGQEILFHRLGDDPLQDRVLHRDEGERTFWLHPDSDGRYLAFKHASGPDENVFIFDLEDGAARPRRVMDGDEAQNSIVGFVAGKLWLNTTVSLPLGSPRGDTHGADRRRIVALDLENPDGTPETIVPEGRWGSLIDAELVGGRLLVHRVEHAVHKLELYALDGRFEREVELPYMGWLRSGLVGSPGERLASFLLQGTADPGSIFLLDVETGEVDRFQAIETGFDPSLYVTRRVFYPAADGTLIPLFLMYKKGLRLDGDNPTWLYAYGSRWAAAPWYSSTHRVWLELGGVYALAHVRGGGEYGKSWIEAGSGIHKGVGIGDYIDAAEWLIESGYTSSAKLVANGGSASAPLVAAAVNRRPEIFAAALIDYGLTDMLRAPKFQSVNSTNFDTPDEPEAYRALRAWSPYHNVAPPYSPKGDIVKNEVCYPATFIAHGSDDRVAAPLHSYKLTAALQAAQGNTACDRPILLQVAWGRGHTVGGPVERANQLAFLVRELGLTVPEG